MDGDGRNEIPVLQSSSDCPFPKKLSNLRNHISADIFATDIKWSLFVGASQSYRYDTCLHPFPPQYVVDGNKDIEKLREVMTHMPSIPTLLTWLENPSTDFSHRVPLIELLHWALIEQNNQFLETVQKDEFPDVLSKVPGECIVPPTYIFRVHHRLKSEVEDKFQEAAKQYGTLFAYHGSKLENFFSVLNYGLLKTLNKRYVYGQGIYLSSDLMVSMLYSRRAFGWGGSIIGSQLSCIAMCELIDHPDVKCQMQGVAASPKRSIAEDSVFGKIPEKHFLAQNSELVQVQYLLIYAENPHPVSCSNISKGSMLGWFNKHKFLTLMVGYVVLLSAVGMSNNPTVMRYYRMLLRRWHH